MEDHIEDEQKNLKVLKGNLTLVQSRMKQKANKQGNRRSFDVRDWVFLRLQPYKKMSLK